MGTVGRSGVERWVLGSDAEEVLRQTPVPILFVRSKSGKK
jgi:nucleotide-binding universal stress UspA family protein